MRERDLDILNFILGLIKTDAYLSFYCKSMCNRMHFRADAFPDALKAFGEFRKEVKNEKIKNKGDKAVTGCLITVDFEPEKTKPNKKKK
ncbi:MAG: hypothetical protein E3J83_03405 [Candidatus Atribacteria bacterium]|nr:MAG: hypothetical protein E3J83_03405 [Candidatus Atribacteria bacterium]